MEQPKMDLPELSSAHLPSDKDGPVTNSETISPESVDTGFVSDDTHTDSPSPLSETKNLGDMAVSESEPTESHQPSVNSEINGEINSIEYDKETPNSVNPSESYQKEPLPSSEEKETEKLISPDSKKTDTPDVVMIKETDSQDETASRKDTETLDLPESKDTGESESSEDKGTPSSEKEEDGCIDILGNGLLKKTVLVAGAGTDSRPTNGDVVTLKVSGVLDNGTPIADEEITFTLNDGDVIVAFELVAALMEKGEKCELFTSSRYAYGELGSQPDIPSNASITYTLELVDVKPPIDIASLSCDGRLLLGEQKRERGNFLFKRTDYTGAINSYSKAVKMLDDTDLNAGLDESNRTKLADCWAKCYNNMAACQLKIDALDAAIRSCEKVLSHQSYNVKALFRLGKAYGAKGEVDKAISHLKKAIKLDPESKIMHQEMLALTRRKTKETESERMLYQRMLGVKAEDLTSKANIKNNNSKSILKWTLALGAVTAAMVSVGLTWYRHS